MSRTCSIRLDDRYERAVLRVVRRGCLVDGPETDALEQDFARVIGTDPDRIVAVSSGTAALQALLLESGIGPGDEVIVPAYTFTATALAVLRVGAEPVLADINATWTLSAGEAEKALSPRTRAAIGVDLDGVPADFDALERVLPENVLLIEDACPALGARLRGREAGLLGRDGAAFSLNESKQLPAGEGGIIVAPNADIAERLRRMRHFGHANPRGDAILTEADEPIADNWKITEMAAALARAGSDSVGNRVMTSRYAGLAIRRALAESPILSAPGIPPGSEPSWYRIRCMAPPGRAADIMHELMRRGVPLAGNAEVAPLASHQTFSSCRRVGGLENARQAWRSFCIGSRTQPIFDMLPAEAERCAEVISSLSI